jgi:YVTN family beta-propeller protein
VNGSIPNLPGPQALLWDPSNGDLFVGEVYGDAVTVVDPANESVVAQVPLRTPMAQPFAEALDPSNGRIFVTESYANALAVISTSPLGYLASVPVGSTPEGIALDSRSGNLYVADNGGNNSTVIDGSTDANVSSINFGAAVGAFGVLYDPTVDQVFISEAQTDNLSVVDPTTQKPVARIALPPSSPYGTSFPEGMALDPADGDIYVADTSNDTLSIVNASRDSLIGSIRVGSGPGGVAYDPVDGYLYVTDQDSGNVTVVNPANGSAFATLRVGQAPFPVVFDPVNDNLYVGNILSDNVSIISTSALPPELSGVAISPPFATLSPGSSVELGSALSCSGGPCPSGARYDWTLTSSLGTLNSSTSSSVTFTAGDLAGNDSVFVNVTLGPRTVEGGPARMEIPSGAPPPTLLAVVVVPGTVELPVGGTQSFLAEATCSNGGCPTGVAYAWQLSGPTGSLNVSSGPEVGFTAGSLPGNDSLTVSASLGGSVLTSSPARVSVTSSALPPPELLAVELSAGTGQLAPGGTDALAAVPVCTEGACPSEVVVRWSLNDSLGTLSASTGANVVFTAGSESGLVVVSVNATLSGRSSSSSLTIRVTAPTSTGPNASGPSQPLWLGLPLDDLLLGALVAALAVIAVLLALRRRAVSPPREGVEPPG